MVDTSGRDLSGGGAGIARVRADAVDDTAARRGTGWDVTLGELRPVPPTAVLDDGFVLFRDRFARLVALAACLFVPITVLDLVLMAVIGTETPDRTAIGPTALLLGSGDSWSWFIVAARALALSMLGIAVGRMAAGACQDRDVGLRELLGVALRRSWVAAVVTVITVLARVVLSCVLPPVGWLLVDGYVFIASTVAGAESCGPLRAIRRSIALTKANYGKALGVCLGSLCVSQVLRISLTLGPELLLSSLGAPSTLVAVLTRLSGLILLLAEPLTACIAVRAYLDLRARSEGFDLELRAARHFGTAAPSSMAAGT